MERNLSHSAFQSQSNVSFQDCENVGMDDEDDIVDVSPGDFSEKLIFADDQENDHQVGDDDTSVLNVAFEACST